MATARMKLKRSICTPLMIKRQEVKEINYVPCGVILGRIGVGKTTLFNMLCGTQHSAGEAAGSVTQKLYFHSVSCGDYPFCLIDTPGTNSKHDTYKHAVLIRESLTAKKVNTIFIIVKYENRFEDILDAYLDVQEVVYKYDKKIVIMISHWDSCKARDRAFIEISKLFENTCANLICYSEDSDNVQVAKLMYACLSNMEQETLEIPDDEFFLRYNICEQKASLTKSLKDYELSLKKCVEDYSELLKKILKDDSVLNERDDVLHYLIIAFRNEVDSLGDEFIKTFSDQISEMHYFTLYIKIQKINIKFSDEFIDLVLPYMSFNPRDPQDPRNMIKRCPHCGEVWFKTEGCDGQTTCGNLPSTSFDNQSTPSSFFKYVFKRINGILQMNLNIIPRRAPTKIDKVSSKAGCGRNIIWKDCPKVADDEIMELFKVQTLDQARKMIKEAKFQEIRSNLEATFDKKFYSD